ncbi:fructokinase [Desulfocucumis palustris]|uniref:Fructokinase n=1 Tax=Desulfocucumis palustris TaxID=1898651 RepID=A0A2L2XD41_9FIRM|nr:sugar kinase [Desulfocucumis palustris]GBF34267.1 fructokinase [Desulfocucumis palustris]
MHWVATVGEILAEVMRTGLNVALSEPGLFAGPYPSGAPAIFADALGKLGVPSAIIGCVGDDDFGKCNIDRLSADGVDISQIRILEDKITGIAFVTYYDDGSRRFLYHIKDSAAGRIKVEDLDKEFLKTVKVLHVNGSSLAINENVRKACYEAAGLVKENGGIVSFDPNLRPEILPLEEIQNYCRPILKKCDYVLPSGGEAQLITGEGAPEDAVKSLLATGIKAVVVKKGEEGSVMYTPSATHVGKSFQVKAVDPTGAGDCFSAGFVYGLLQGWPRERILTFANAMGALATTKPGPMEGSRTLSQINEFMEISNN